MTSSWLPPWLGTTWVVLMAVVAVVHVRHLLTLPDITRAWHTGHVLMAVGMAVMFWPGGALLTPTVGVVGRVVFVAAALAAATWSVVDRRRRGRWSSVWPLLAADLAAMVWMFAVMAPGDAGMDAAMGSGGSMTSMTMGPTWVNAVLALWFAVEAVRWLSGSLVRSAERDLHLELPVETLQRSTASAATSASAVTATGEDAAATGGAHGAVRGAAHGADGHAPATPAGAHAWHGVSLRATLTVMSAGMTSMLAAMAFGVSSVPMGGPGGM